ncbi:hypothetical protein D6777_00970 [Candidatus Woesearchaeota archaeon]|nr:MAG: hypothetical protein D6777_00970 [Candidatus Woesearchaeota archaeon]
MRIQIIGTDGNKLFDGELSHVEGGLTEGKPSFHLSCYQKMKGEVELQFYLNDKKELEDFLDRIKEAVK